MQKIIKFGVLLVVSIFFMQFAWFLGTKEGKNNTTLSADNVNLALRRTAHLLLKGIGDTIGCIDMFHC